MAVTAQSAPDAPIFPGLPEVESPAIPEAPEPPGPDPVEVAGADRPVPVLTTVGAAAFSSAAAAWMVAGVFKGILPEIVAVGAALLGCGIVYLSYRQRREFIQYLVLPLGAVAGAALVVPFAEKNTGLISLVVEAITQGGLAQPPVPFDPGWRFIIVVVFTLMGAAAASVAIAANRPKLATLVPVPLAVAASLVQPPATEVISVVVGAAGMCVSLALAQGAELARQGELGAGFETRRLLRGAGMVVGLVVLLVIVSRTGFLFPTADRTTVIPPQRPQIPPPSPDRPLFEIKTPIKVPVRLGVIDVYQYDAKSGSGAWLLPPFDTRRLTKVSPGADFNKFPGAATRASNPIEITIRVDEATGHQLPDAAGMLVLKDMPRQADYDPRANTLRLTDDRVYKGMTYQFTVESPPTGADLEKADPAGHALDEFKDAPPVPAEVAQVLTTAPSNPFDRLYAVRKALYDKVVAAGSGTPVDVAPSRVVDMLKGGEATPYEISAAEALLGRWAGLPCRVGYGYYGGLPSSEGFVEIRPKHGSTWLECYFEGYSWVPIIGTPPQAKPSSKTSSKNNDPNIKPTTNFDLLVYVPESKETFLQYFDYVRYWLVVSLPFVLVLGLMAFLYPGPIKVLRTLRRRHWANETGFGARMAVAYCEFRDKCTDLTVGDPSATPLEFLQFLERDQEHQELAWLVTRAWWGDLDRDLREDDAASAERLARSLTKRFVSAQPVLNRFLAFSARSSLVEPYTREVPNLWRSGPFKRVGAWIRRRLSFRRQPSRRLARLGTT